MNIHNGSINEVQITHIVNGGFLCIFYPYGKKCIQLWSSKTFERPGFTNP